MRVRVDALEARRVADEVGPDKVTRRHNDGSVDLVLGVASFASIRSWVLALLDHATVLGPPVFREELMAWLRGLAEAAPASPSLARASSGTPGPGGSGAAPRGADGASGEGADRGAAAPKSPPGAETSRRLRRLLALVGWLAQVGEAPTAEAAPPVRHDRAGAGRRAGVGRLLRDPAVHPGHAHGDRGVGALGPSVLARAVRPTTPPHTRRGLCRGRVGPPPPRGARLRRRRVAPCPGQARCGAGVQRGTRPGGGRARAPGGGARRRQKRGNRSRSTTCPDRATS